MSLPATIQTAISPDAISRASRLFSGSALDALHELLQNARRAGATRIAIDLVEQAGQSWLSIRDDGSGVDDPAALLTLRRRAATGLTRAATEVPIHHRRTGHAPSIRLRLLRHSSPG